MGLGGLGERPAVLHVDADLAGLEDREELPGGLLEILAAGRVAEERGARQEERPLESQLAEVEGGTGPEALP